MIRMNCKIIRLSHSSPKIYIIILECNTNSLALIESDWTSQDGVSYLIRGCLNRERKILAPGKSVEADHPSAVFSVFSLHAKICTCT